MRNGSNSDKHGGVWNGQGLPSEVRADQGTEWVIQGAPAIVGHPARNRGGGAFVRSTPIEVTPALS
jgi:hypothetical protein